MRNREADGSCTGALSRPKQRVFFALRHSGRYVQTVSL